MENLSKIATPLLALVVLVGVLVLLALGQPVPNELWAGMTLVLGFFFGKQ